MNDVAVITDIGVDDAIALVLLDKLLPQTKKTLVTSYGNCPSDVIEKNGLEFVSVMPQWKLAIGAKYPEGHAAPMFTAEDFHGQDGLWGVRPPRSNRQVRLTAVESSRFVSLGPLTYLNQYQKKADVAEVTVMAGRFDEPRPEPNIRMDVRAAKDFFKNCSGVQVRVVPMDVSGRVRWSKEDILAIPESNVVNIWLKQLMLAWFANCPYDSFALHDPVAVYLSVLPELVDWKNGGISVSDNGITRLDSDLPICKIAQPTEDPGLLAKDIFSTLFHDRR